MKTLRQLIAQLEQLAEVHGDLQVAIWDDRDDEWADPDARVVQDPRAARPLLIELPFVEIY